MSDFVFNIAKGRVVELYNRVDTNSPSGCKLVIMAVNRGSVTDATLRDLDTFAAVLSSVTEANNSGYARKNLVAADLAAFAPDDSVDRIDLDLPDQTWTTVTTGMSWTDLITGYDAAGTGTNSGIVPMTCHTFVAQPNGQNVVAQIPSGFFRAA